MSSYTFIWLSILAIGAGTFLLRFTFLQLAGRIALPHAVTRALRFLPAAVLSAIILPAILRTAPGTLYFGLDNPRLIAGAVAALVAPRRARRAEAAHPRALAPSHFRGARGLPASSCHEVH